MTLRFIFYNKSIAFASGELGIAGLLGIKMVETRLATDYFAVFGKLQPL